MGHTRYTSHCILSETENKQYFCISANKESFNMTFYLKPKKEVVFVSDTTLYTQNYAGVDQLCCTEYTYHTCIGPVVRCS